MFRSCENSVRTVHCERWLFFLYHRQMYKNDHEADVQGCCLIVCTMELGNINCFRELQNIFSYILV